MRQAFFMGSVNEEDKKAMDQLRRGELEPDSYIDNLTKLITYRNNIINAYHYYGNKNTDTMIENYKMEIKNINEHIRLLLGV